MKDFLITTLIFLGTILVIALLIALPFMWVWDAIMPDLFNLPTITFWQSLGLIFLGQCLFNSNSSKKD